MSINEIIKVVKQKNTSVIKRFSPSTSSSPGLISSPPGNLKKLFPAVVVTHGVARAHEQ